MQVTLNAANMNELAQRVASTVTGLGFTKEGTAMCASQGLRVLASLAGYRQEHALVSALKNEMPKSEQLAACLPLATCGQADRQVEESLCSECGAALDLDGFDGRCGDCADIEESLVELAEELKVNLADVKFWVITHYGTALEGESQVRREQLVQAYRRLFGLAPSDAPAVAYAKGHTNDDSVTTLDSVTINGEDYDLRVCGAGSQAYFEWINAGGDPVGDVLEELSEAKAFALELAKRPNYGDIADADVFECATCHVKSDIEDSIQQGGVLRCLTCANRAAADAVFEVYNFGDQFSVASHNGWEWVSGDSVMSKSVFLEDRYHPEAATRRVRFVVNVVEGIVTDFSLEGMPD